MMVSKCWVVRGRWRVAPWEVVPMGGGGGGGVEGGLGRHLQPPSATTQSSTNCCSQLTSDAGGGRPPSHPAARAGRRPLLGPQTHSGAWSRPVWQVAGSPEQMRSSGRDASLHCDFDTQGEELYSVKWYKVDWYCKKSNNHKCYRTRGVKRCFGGCPPSPANPSQSIQGLASELTRCTLNWPVALPAIYVFQGTFLKMAGEKVCLILRAKKYANEKKWSHWKVASLPILHTARSLGAPLLPGEMNFPSLQCKLEFNPLFIFCKLHNQCIYFWNITSADHTCRLLTDGYCCWLWWFLLLFGEKFIWWNVEINIVPPGLSKL